MFVLHTKNCGVAMCIHVQFRIHKENKKSGVNECKGISSFKVYANFCNCLFVPKRIRSFTRWQRVNAAEIFCFYGTYICQPHAICKHLFPFVSLYSYTYTHMVNFYLSFRLSPTWLGLFVVRRKIFNLNMYNASKKLPSSSTRHQQWYRWQQHQHRSSYGKLYI